MATTAYEQGREDYMRGKDPRKCPYSGDAMRAAWMKGWEDRKREFEES